MAVNTELLALFKEGALLGSTFAGGIVGNLAASALWEGGKWALQPLQARARDLALLLTTETADGDLHLLRAVRRAERRVVVALCDRILLRDYGLPAGGGPLLQQLQTRLAASRDAGLAALCELRRIFAHDYAALRRVPAAQLRELHGAALADVDAIAQAGMWCLEATDPDAVRQALVEQQIHALQVALHSPTSPLLHRRERGAQLIDGAHWVRLTEEMRGHPQGWWDLMRVAFRAELDEPWATSARQVWERDVLALLSQQMGRSHLDLVQRFDGMDLHLRRVWEQLVLTGTELQAALTAISSQVAAVLAAMEAQSWAIEALRTQLDNEVRGAIPSDMPLQAWRDAILANSAWTRIRAPLQGHDAIDLQDMYVDLHVVATAKHLAPQADERRESYPPIFRELGASAMAVDAFVARVTDRAVIVGAPGAGKSTLFAWLTCAVARGQLVDYSLPVSIRLREFALRHQAQPGLRLVAHYLESMGLCAGGELPSLTSAMQAQLHADARTGRRRFLFLLDGWDEVPTAQRAAMREVIDRETTGTPTMISTRPSGIPQYLVRAGSQVAEISALSNVAVYEYCARHAMAVGRPALAHHVLRLIEERPALHALATNPYLLSLLSEVLASADAPPPDEQVTAAWILSRAVGILMQDHNQNMADAPLDRGALERLQTLAGELSLGGPGKDTQFDARRLAEGAGTSVTDSALARSRFVNLEASGLGGASFTHLRLQEFLAARDLLRGPDYRVAQFGARKALTLVWQEEAGFAAATLATDAQRDAFWSSIRRAIEAPDSGYEVWRRAARLLADSGAGAQLASGWATGQGIDLRARLFDLIKAHPMGAARNARALLALDAEYLARRVRELPLNHMNLWQAVYPLIPVTLRQRSGLDAFLADEPVFSQMLGMAATGFQYIEGRQALHAQLLDGVVPLEQKIQIVRDLGAARDWTSVPALLGPLDSEAAELVQAASRALSKIGSRDAARGLAERYLRGCRTDETEVRERLVSDLADCLEPATRDRLVGVLGQASDSDADRELLTDLANILSTVPLPEPPIALLQILVRPGTPWAEARQSAARALAGVRHPAYLREALSIAEQVEDEETRTAIWDNVPFIPAAEGALDAMILRMVDDTLPAPLREPVVGLLLRTARQRPHDPSLDAVFDFVASCLTALPVVAPSAEDVVRACIDGADALPDRYGMPERLAAIILNEAVEGAMRAGAVRALTRMQAAYRRFDLLSIFTSALESLPSSPQARGFLVSLAQTAVRADMRTALSIVEKLRPRLSSADARNAQMVLHQVIEAAIEQGWLLYPRHVVAPDGGCWTLDGQSEDYRPADPPWV